MTHRSRYPPKADLILGSQEFVDQFITEKVNQWKELMLLMDIAKVLVLLV